MCAADVVVVQKLCMTNQNSLTARTADQNGKSIMV
jgi:hypothetical protein